MLQTILLLTASVTTTVIAQLLIKKGALVLGDLELSFSSFLSLIPKVLQNIWLMVGIFLFGTAFLLWVLILSKFQLNIAYPVVVSLNICFITIISWFLLKEYLALIQILGIVIIIFGIFLVLSKGTL